ncbi:MAG: EamA family transporter [Lachnospiraceae bacterium]|nr:EamA family transporter [Lachnospiraceae bacterium]
MNKSLRLRDILALQGIVMVFSLSSVVAKFASEQTVFTGGFFLFYGLEVLVLAVYALLWQQAIKRFDISIAYANKAMVLLWGLLWSVLIFRDSITPRKILGVALVIIGVIVLNREPEGEKA